MSRRKRYVYQFKSLTNWTRQLPKGYQPPNRKAPGAFKVRRLGKFKIFGGEQ